MVFRNRPQPLDHTDRFNPKLRRWDAEYRLRARKWGIFHACDKVYLELYNPPILTDTVLKRIFSTIPATQTPPSITRQQFDALAALTA